VLHPDQHCHARITIGVRVEVPLGRPAACAPCSCLLYADSCPSRLVGAGVLRRYRDRKALPTHETGQTDPV